MPECQDRNWKRDEVEVFDLIVHGGGGIHVTRCPVDIMIQGL